MRVLQLLRQFDEMDTAVLTGESEGKPTLGSAKVLEQKRRWSRK